MNKFLFDSTNKWYVPGLQYGSIFKNFRINFYRLSTFLKGVLFNVFSIFSTCPFRTIKRETRIDHILSPLSINRGYSGNSQNKTFCPTSSLNLPICLVRHNFLSCNQSQIIFSFVKFLQKSQRKFTYASIHQVFPFNGFTRKKYKIRIKNNLFPFFKDIRV